MNSMISICFVRLFVEGMDMLEHERFTHPS